MTKHRASRPPAPEPECSKLSVYDSQAEREQHAQAVEALAVESNRDVFEVRQVYERTYAALKSEATVKDYLPLFVTRRVRALLRDR